MTLKIITPTGVRFNGEVGRFQFPAHTGLMEFLPGHDKMIAELKAGSIITDKETLECGGGVVRIENDEITVVCE